MAKSRTLKDVFVEKYLTTILKDASRDKFESLNKSSFKMLCENVKYMTILQNNKPVSLSDDLSLLNYIIDNTKNYIFELSAGQSKILAQEIFASMLFIKKIRPSEKKDYIKSMVDKTLRLIKKL